MKKELEARGWGQTRGKALVAGPLKKDIFFAPPIGIAMNIYIYRYRTVENKAGWRMHAYKLSWIKITLL